MASKTISITQEVYTALIKAKAPDQSFSQEIKSLLQRKGHLSDCAGLWQWMPAKEITAIENVIQKSKEKARTRWKQRLGAME